VVRALPVFLKQTCWFLPHGNAGCAEGTVVQRLMQSFKAWCLTARLGASLQNKPRVPVASTKLPQQQVYGLPSSEPSLSAIIVIVIIISQKPQNQNPILVHVACRCVSVLRWRRCGKLCISGFVDDVMFAHYRLGTDDDNRASYSK